MNEIDKLGYFITLEKFANADIDKLMEALMQKAEEASKEFHKNREHQEYSPYSHGYIKGYVTTLLLDLQNGIRKELEIKEKFPRIRALRRDRRFGHG